jgi:hypothetical protein
MRWYFWLVLMSSGLKSIKIALSRESEPAPSTIQINRNLYGRESGNLLE